jgi:undecaprenyl-diphosphatase
MIQRSPMLINLSFMQEKGVLFFIIFSFALTNVSFGESLDRKLFDTIHTDWKSPFLDELMPSITTFGDDVTGIVFTGTLIAFGDEKGRDSGILSAVALTGSSLITLGMKSAINRNRPKDPEGRTRRSNSSFPSGHASGAFSVATVIGGRYPKARIPAYTLASLVGFSRIYLGRHYPSDVLGGAVLGIASGIVVLQLDDKILGIFD